MIQSKLRILFFLLVLISMFTSCFNLKKDSKDAKKFRCAMVMEKSDFAEELPDDALELVFAKIEEVITQRKDLIVLDRSRYEDITQEKQFQLSDLASSEKKAEIGKALNANFLCIITIYKENYKVEFLNVESLQQRTYTGDFKISLISKELKVKGLNNLSKLNIVDLLQER